MLRIKRRFLVLRLLYVFHLYINTITLESSIQLMDVHFNLRPPPLVVYMEKGAEGILTL
jgi:hypothetical protein